MRRSRFRGRGFRRKRSVSWLAGFSSYDAGAGTSNRLIALAAIPGSPNVWGASIGLVIPGDLPLHGGEDCVLARVVGRLGFMDGRKDAGAGPAAFGFQMHVALVQSDFLPGGTVTPWDFTSSVGLGNDDIMFFQDIIVPGTSVLVTPGATPPVSDQPSFEMSLDITTKRKIDSNRQLVLWFQSAFDAAVTTQVDFRLYGGLRMLMMRPS